MMKFKRNTPPKFNMEPENDAFQRESPFGMAYFQGRTVSFRGGIKKKMCDNAMVLGHFLESAFAEKNIVECLGYAVIPTGSVGLGTF